ncbi:hypothetical protein QBC36DRAFT_312859 [Triangularia setosa]|uniref:Uncharacterized protein n=1 Tax=Triangularia setosa TaxID=2587417 RepID=A0AAN6W3H3_9PEZI|nr:hypothetical protein QBC36DRAFT_312859 [Podospora setosa]
MLRVGLLKDLRDLATDPRFAKLHLLVVSCEYVDIETTMSTCAMSLSMSSGLVDEDIEIYVQSQLAKHPKLQHWPTSIQLKVPMGGLPNRRMTMAELEMSVMNKALSHWPQTLDVTYERILHQISTEAYEIVRYACLWIYWHTNSARHSWAQQTNIRCSVLLDAIQESLKVNGLHVSLGYDLDAELLREFCGCLIITSPEERPISHGKERAGRKGWLDEPSTMTILTVSLAHYAVVEFLQSSRAPRHTRLKTNMLRRHSDHPTHHIESQEG